MTDGECEKWITARECTCGKTCERWVPGNLNGCCGEIHEDEVEVDGKYGPDYAWAHYCDAHYARR